MLDMEPSAAVSKYVWAELLTDTTSSSSYQSGNFHRTEATSDARAYLTPLTLSPFSNDGESIKVNPGLMDTKKPYVFSFMDWWFVAVKQADETVDFYYVGGQNADL